MPSPNILILYTHNTHPHAHPIPIRITEYLRTEKKNWLSLTFSSLNYEKNVLFRNKIGQQFWMYSFKLHFFPTLILLNSEI